MDIGSNGFMLICAAFVFIMTPGLAFFYGGLVRRKNVINTMMNCVGVMGISVVMWVAFGYSLSFSGDNEGIIGNLQNEFFMGMRPSDTLDGTDGTISVYTFAMFQMMFAMITPALISGSVAGRMRFKAFFLFVILWSIVVYYPMAHMVWGGGLLGTGWLDSIDFAGGNVVHISSGVTGLVLAIILGKRRGLGQASYRVHNVPFVFLGAALLWFGWFGFNAGSGLLADGLASHAFATTAVASASALVSWMIIDIIKEGKPTLVGASTGLVIGLVAITPGAGFVPVWASFIIGALVSPICYGCMHLIKNKLKIDDTLDAFGCHGIGGIWGGIATGLFADATINPSVQYTNGLVFGDAHQFLVQLLSIVITIAVAIVGTLICVGITRLVTKLRVDPQEEKLGMDYSQHGESAYPSFNGLD